MRELHCMCRRGQSERARATSPDRKEKKAQPADRPSAGRKELRVIIGRITRRVQESFREKRPQERSPALEK